MTDQTRERQLRGLLEGYGIATGHINARDFAALAVDIRAALIAGVPPAEPPTVQRDCPRCGADKAKQERIAGVWLCQACGHEWNQETAAMRRAEPKRCNDFAPAGYTGHWREWHRGHGCNLDESAGVPPEPSQEQALAANVLATWGKMRAEGHDPLDAWDSVSALLRDALSSR